MTPITPEERARWRAGEFSYANAEELSACRRLLAALDLAEALAAAHDEMMAALNEYGPMPSHRGFCGPESGCDAACMDAAAFSRHMRAWSDALAAYRAGVTHEN